jgi:hypothetical protein
MFAPLHLGECFLAYLLPLANMKASKGLRMDSATDPNEEDLVSSVHSGHDHNATASPQQGTPPRELTKWHYRKGEQLGKGAYGVVHKAYLVDTGQLVAVKQVCLILLLRVPVVTTAGLRCT